MAHPPSLQSRRRIDFRVKLMVLLRPIRLGKPDCLVAQTATSAVLPTRRIARGGGASGPVAGAGQFG